MDHWPARINHPEEWQLQGRGGHLLSIDAIVGYVRRYIFARIVVDEDDKGSETAQAVEICR